MNKALTELIRISNTVGKDTTLVQGGGGNTSVKTADGKYMFIKASGTALKDMNAKKGWRRMSLGSVRAIIDDKKLAKQNASKREVEVVNRLAMACDDDLDSGSRPSVEAHLHAMLENCVIHLHPITVGTYVNTVGGKALLEKLFKNEKLPPLWVPYVDPGLMLAKKIQTLVNGYIKQYKKAPSILFLEKHGLFVAAKTPNTALRITRRVIKLCASKLKCPPAKKAKQPDKKLITQTKLNIRKAFFEATNQRTLVQFYVDNELASYLALKQTKDLLAKQSITPDELVYSNGSALYLENSNPKTITKKLKTQLAKGEKPAKAFVVKGLGLFVTANKKTGDIIRDIVASSLFIRYNANRMGGIYSLNKRERDFINNWEAEAFRQTLVAGTNAGLLKDRIAVVTGAGSGIGKSIATGLVRAGATVAFADIDLDAATQAVAEITAEIPSVHAAAFPCNVTDETSVFESFDNIVDTFGGLDILVNAAGVAPAFPLVDFPVDKFRFALEVNLTGYFLMAKYAAKTMIAQNIGGSIINISSKSGIDASKNNSPYNATKAGELHLARGWAMELGEYGIRVNSVCPGNVFEGSKIWNPQYIKVCAKKYGIKPEEVIPYYVDKTMLKQEIKGQNIADAVIFLASDMAERITAQTIVADAGQAVVR